jgi:hypothetical protein
LKVENTPVNLPLISVDVVILFYKTRYVGEDRVLQGEFSADNLAPVSILAHPMMRFAAEMQSAHGSDGQAHISMRQ